MIRPRVLLILPRYRGLNHGLFLGIAALSASLKASGAEVEVFDEDVAAEAEAQTGSLTGAILRRMLDSFAPTLIGVHVNTPNYSAALRMACSIREYSDAPLVAGGPHATAAAECLLNSHPEFDYVLRGEADQSLPQLAWALETNSPVDSVPGLVWRVDRSVVCNRRWALLNLDALPQPDRLALLHPSDSDLKRCARSHYTRNFTSTIPSFQGREVAGCHASRGCDYSCPFCSPGAFWTDPLSNRPIRRLRPVGSLLRELVEVRNLGYGAVFFDEPTFPLGSQPRWINEFMPGIKNLDLLWGAPTRVEELTPKILPALAASGLRYVYFGLETPDAGLRSHLRKTLDFEMLCDRIRACGDNGIQCDVSLFFGAPGETEATIQWTLDWMDKSLPRGNAFFSVAAFWPETQWSRNQGLTPQHWEPDYERRRAADLGAVWYPEDLTPIDKFYSNSTGTYHPAFMTIDRALGIKQQIIESGFRARFSLLSRRRGAEVSP